jgi:hypothetical protein
MEVRNFNFEIQNTGEIKARQREQSGKVDSLWRTAQADDIWRVVQAEGRANFRGGRPLMDGVGRGARGRPGGRPLRQAVGVSDGWRMSKKGLGRLTRLGDIRRLNNLGQRG